MLRVAQQPPSLRGGDRETRALVVVAPQHKSRLWTMVPAVNVDDAAASPAAAAASASSRRRCAVESEGLRELDL